MHYQILRYKQRITQATACSVNVSPGPEPDFASRYSSFDTFMNEGRNHVLIDIENVVQITYDFIREAERSLDLLKVIALTIFFLAIKSFPIVVLGSLEHKELQ